jgi:DNA-binding HxlR family transcriptional regulator
VPLDIVVSMGVYDAACPTRVLLDRIGDKWTVLVVGALGPGPLRFTPLRETVGVTSKVLTETLRALERDGLLTRHAYSENPPRVEYELTALGRSLNQPLASVRRWAEAHYDEVRAARESYLGRLDHSPPHTPD